MQPRQQCMACSLSSKSYPFYVVLQLPKKQMLHFTKPFKQCKTRCKPDEELQPSTSHNDCKNTIWTGNIRSLSGEPPDQCFETGKGEKKYTSGQWDRISLEKVSVSSGACEHHNRVTRCIERCSIICCTGLLVDDYLWWWCKYDSKNHNTASIVQKKHHDIMVIHYFAHGLGLAFTDCLK